MAEGQGVQIPRVQLGSQGLEVKLMSLVDPPLFPPTLFTIET